MTLCGGGVSGATECLVGKPFVFSVHFCGEKCFRGCNICSKALWLDTIYVKPSP